MLFWIVWIPMDDEGWSASRLDCTGAMVWAEVRGAETSTSSMRTAWAPSAEASAAPRGPLRKPRAKAAPANCKGIRKRTGVRFTRAS